MKMVRLEGERVILLPLQTAGTRAGSSRGADSEQSGQIACGPLDLTITATDHLEAVTHRENMSRSPNNIAVKNRLKTHCPHGHPYDQANTLVTPHGGLGLPRPND